MSLTSVDFPEPLTPVTATKQPSGTSRSTPLRLCSRAFSTRIDAPRVARAALGAHRDLGLAVR
jgi:hypothetical protein